MKKWLAFVLVLLMVPVWCFTAGAEDAFSMLLNMFGDKLSVSTGQNDDKLGVCNGFAYEIVDAETAVIRSVGFGAVIQGKVTIPDTLDGRKITGLSNITLGITASETVSKNKPVVKSIIIPDSIENISPGAFRRFEDIETFAVSPDNSFFESIDGVLISKSDNRLLCFPIGKKGSYRVPEGIQIIGNYAFEKSKIKEIVIPDSVKSIGEFAFSECDQLVAMSVPASIEINLEGIFFGCEKPLKITVRPADPTNIEVIDDVLYCWSNKTLCALPGFSAKSLVIPDGIEAIPGRAFDYNNTLISVTIPEGVTSIGRGAFQRCESLTEITIPDSVTSIGRAAFQNCKSLTEITIPEGVTFIGNYTFNHCSSLTKITLPNSLTTIEGVSFQGLVSLTSLTLPDNLTSIEANTFWFCSSLKEITIPNSVTSIGFQAFAFCQSLTDITIPDSVTSLGDKVFKNCKSLSEVTIPSSVVEIGENAFEGCDLLTAKVMKDSFAMEYCKKNNIKYEIID